MARNSQRAAPATVTLHDDCALDRLKAWRADRDSVLVCISSHCAGTAWRVSTIGVTKRTPSNIGIGYCRTGSTGRDGDREGDTGNLTGDRKAVVGLAGYQEDRSRCLRNKGAVHYDSPPPNGMQAEPRRDTGMFTNTILPSENGGDGGDSSNRLLGGGLTEPELAQHQGGR